MESPNKHQDEGRETEHREALPDFDEHLPGCARWVTSCSLMAVSLTPSSHHLHELSSVYNLAHSRSAIRRARNAVTLQWEPAAYIIMQEGMHCAHTHTHTHCKHFTYSHLRPSPGYTHTNTQMATAERADTLVKSIRIEAPSPLQLINSP